VLQCATVTDEPFSPNFSRLKSALVALNMRAVYNSMSIIHLLSIIFLSFPPGSRAQVRCLILTIPVCNEWRLETLNRNLSLLPGSKQSSCWNQRSWIYFFFHERQGVKLPLNSCLMPQCFFFFSFLEPIFRNVLRQEKKEMRLWSLVGRVGSRKGDEWVTRSTSLRCDEVITYSAIRRFITTIKILAAHDR